MKRPNEVLLGAFNWGVEFREISEEEAEGFESLPENILGFTDRRNLKMYIDQELSSQVSRLTFLHELVHALCGSFHLGFNDTENEEMVDAIAKGFYNFIKQNQKAVEWLMKEE